MESAHFTVKPSPLRGLKMASRTTHATQTNPGENLMPIFEYACRTCGKEFEKLVRQSDPVLACPACQSGELTQKCRPLPHSPAAACPLTPQHLPAVDRAATPTARAPASSTNLIDLQ